MKPLPYNPPGRISDAKALRLALLEAARVTRIDREVRARYPGAFGLARAQP